MKIKFIIITFITVLLSELYSIFFHLFEIGLSYSSFLQPKRINKKKYLKEMNITPFQKKEKEYSYENISCG